MKHIRIAQIGTGHAHAAAAFAALKFHSDIFEIVGVAEPVPGRVETTLRKKTYEGYPVYTAEELLTMPDLDAVTVETDELYLSRYALMAAERGLHVHMDKPGGIEPDEFEKLVETARRNGSVLHLGYMYRYNPSVMELLQQVKNGELGKILSVEAHMSCHCSKGEKESLCQVPGGMFFFLGCHLVDLILQIMGEPECVVPLNGKTGLDGMDCFDNGMAALMYPTGASFAKSSASETGGFYRRQLVVSGTEKTVELKPLEALLPESLQYTDRCDYCEIDPVATRGLEQSDFLKTSRSVPFHRYRDMLQAFGRMAAGEKENPYTYDYELMLYRTLMRCCGVKI